MPRNARKKCASGIYHVIMRGINRQDIFHEEEDYQLFLDSLKRAKILGNFSIYAYCLLENHVHLLLAEKEDNLAVAMKRIGVRYAWWYNQKYKRTGHVFQDRYKSEPVEDDTYLLTVVRYIHNNPVKAELSKTPEEYAWSSCRIYYGEKEYPAGLTDTECVLGLFAQDQEMAKAKFKGYMKQLEPVSCLDIDNEIKRKISDEDLYNEIKKIMAGQAVSELQSIEKQQRDEILRKVKKIEGATQRQIARVTGVGQSIIFKA